MDIEEIYPKLCYYDRRNPNNTLEPNEKQKPRQDCYCDNCFYGRDALALEILQLKEQISILTFKP